MKSPCQTLPYLGRLDRADMFDQVGSSHFCWSQIVKIFPDGLFFLHMCDIGTSQDLEGGGNDFSYTTARTPPEVVAEHAACGPGAAARAPLRPPRAAPLFLPRIPQERAGCALFLRVRTLSYGNGGRYGRQQRGRVAGRIPRERRALRQHRVHQGLCVLPVGRLPHERRCAVRACLGRYQRC